MSQSKSFVNSVRPQPLKNVAACMVLVNSLIHRAPSLPGIGVMYSPSGYGKTQAAIYAQNKTGAIRVEVGHLWRAKDFLTSILRELGEPQPRGTIASLDAQTVDMLGDDPMRPLIIDEADKLVDNGLIEIVRGLHEQSQAPILLIGEERLPDKLKKTERVHNRVLEWLPAQPCDLDDALKLAAVFAPGIKIAPALMTRLLDKTGGRARRLVTNFDGLARWARNSGVTSVPPDWDGPIYTGEPPARRAVRA